MRLVLTIHRWIPTRELDDSKSDDLVWALLWPWAITLGLAAGSSSWLLAAWLGA